MHVSNLAITENARCTSQQIARHASRCAQSAQQSAAAQHQQPQHAAQQIAARALELAQSVEKDSTEWIVQQRSQIASNLPDDDTEWGTCEEEHAERQKLVSRLMYRSKQRGFLELDLLVGLWAQKHLPNMSLPALQAFSEVLDVDNPDLFKWLTGQMPADAGIAQNPSFQAMQADIASRLQDTRPQQSATQPGKVWLRGWDDWKKEQQPAAKQ